MIDKFSGLFLFLAVAAILESAGCSGGPVIPQTATVKGKVLYQDKPLADAQIGFVSKLDNKSVFPAHGTTNAAGEFTLSTYIDPQHEVPGATPGEYVVTVIKNETMDQEKMMAEFNANPAMTFKALVPEKYIDAQTSPLTATVKAGTDNSFEFKLED